VQVGPDSFGPPPIADGCSVEKERDTLLCVFSRIFSFFPFVLPFLDVCQFRISVKPAFPPQFLPAFEASMARPLLRIFVSLGLSRPFYCFFSGFTLILYAPLHPKNPSSLVALPRLFLLMSRLGFLRLHAAYSP